MSGSYTVPLGNVVPLPFADSIPPPPTPLRYTSAARTLPWSQASRRMRAVSAVASTPNWKRRAAALPWSAAPNVARSIAMPWSQVPQRTRATVWRWGAAPKLLAATSLPWRDLPSRVRTAGLRWGAPPVRQHGTSMQWTSPPLKECASTLPWGTPPKVLHAATVPWSLPPMRERRWELPWRNAPLVRWIVHSPGVDPPDDTPPWHYVPPDGNRVALNFVCPQLTFDGNSVPVPLGPAACYFAWPQPRRYIVLNTANVVRLPERTPINVAGGSLSSRVDDSVWSLALDLADPADLALLKPDTGGPKVVEVNLNGYVWTAIINGWNQDRDFPARRVRVSGASQTALLAEPYAPPHSKIVSDKTLAQQQMEAELEFTGFSIDYDTVAWKPSKLGPWSYEGLAALSAIRLIAAAAGAVVQPHMWDKVLQVRPRYPVSPWNWLTTAPDKQIQDDIILHDAMRPEGKPLYDYVLVSGQQYGVSDPIQRTGSAGETRAAMVIDPLIQEHPVALERGRNVLSDRGQQAIIDIVIPLFPSSQPEQPGLILPLHLVEVIEVAPWKAQCNSTSIEFRRVETDTGSALVIDQTVSLERHYDDAN